MGKRLNLDYNELLDTYNQTGSYSATAKIFNTTRQTVSKILNPIKDIEKYNLSNITKKINRNDIQSLCKELGMNEEALSKYVQVLKLNQKLAKNEQKYRDITNVKGKHFREYVREENALEELAKSIYDCIRKDSFNYSLKTDSKKYNKINNNNIGIIQLSDLHLNEQVDIDSNQYNWNIASKRLKKFIDYSLNIFEHNNVGRVLIVGTGDFINSDRRLDELMTNSDNRAKAVVLAYKLIRTAIQHVATKYDVTYNFVCGNESRIDQEIQNAKILVSNNFDYMIGTLLYAFFETNKKVNIILPDDNPEEQIIKIFDEYLLLIHGHKGINDNIENSLAKIISKYSRTKRINISYTMYGHIHSCLIGDNFSRSGSLVGDNEYSFGKLQLSGRASQNCYVFKPDGTKNCFRVDLQYVDDVEGYHFNNDLESYNNKSKTKTHDETVIVKVVI